MALSFHDQKWQAFREQMRALERGKAVPEGGQPLEVAEVRVTASDVVLIRVTAHDADGNLLPLQMTAMLMTRANQVGERLKALTGAEYVVFDDMIDISVWSADGSDDD